MARRDLSEQEWVLIESLLPAERGRKSQPSLDNRRYLNGMLQVLRIGCLWHDMSGTANEIRFMAGFDAGRNKAYRMRFWKPSSNRA